MKSKQRVKTNAISFYSPAIRDALIRLYKTSIERIDHLLTDTYGEQTIFKIIQHMSAPDTKLEVSTMILEYLLNNQYTGSAVPLDINLNEIELDHDVEEVLKLFIDRFDDADMESDEDYTEALDDFIKTTSRIMHEAFGLFEKEKASENLEDFLVSAQYILIEETFSIVSIFNGSE